MAFRAHLTLAAALAAVIAFAPLAEARDWHGGGYRGGYHGGRGGNAAGAAIVGGLIGLGVGAAIASHGYAAPPPVYYGGPGYYPAPPAVYYGY